MKEVEWKNLVRGDIYYIERILFKKENQSGKKVGIFLEVKDLEGIPYAHFNNLTDLPNATKDSGMGSRHTSEYSTNNYKFYKPSDKKESVLKADEEDVQNRKTLIGNMLNHPDGTGNPDVAKHTESFLGAKSVLGGKRKSKKQRKSAFWCPRIPDFSDF